MTSFSQMKKYIEELPTDAVRKYSAEQMFDERALDGLPIIEGDNSVIFLYKGNVREVSLFGDMTLWTDKKSFSRLADTDVFYLEEEYPSAARLQYWFLIDEKQAPVLDPFNPNKIGNGLGLMSELAMPEYIRDPIFNPYIDGSEGTMDDLVEYHLPSGVLPYEHTVHVFKPEGIGPGPYSTIYFQDGLDYLRFAHAPMIISRLMKERRIPPSIGVFVTPPNLHIDKLPNRSTEYGLNDDYTSFFCNELVPFIDKKYLTARRAEARIVVGDSYGGLASTYIGISRPDVFGRVCSQSGYYSYQSDRIIKQMSETFLPELRLYMHVGSFEQKIGASFIPEDEQDFAAANLRMKTVLEKRGWDFKFKLSDEGHTWGNWRGHLTDALLFLTASENNYVNGSC